VQELVTGERLRFSVEPSGMLRFGDEVHTFDGNIPLHYRRAADLLRRSIDLEVLRETLEDISTVTFFGIATLHEGVNYDMSSLPEFLGVDIWSEETDGYLPPGAASSAYRSLGLSPLPAFEKEADVKYTDIDGYASGSVPESQFYDGRAAGVLVRDKSGGRGEVWRDYSDGDDASGSTAEELAEEYVTGSEIDRAVGDVSGEGASLEGVVDRVVADMVRESYGSLYSGGDAVVPEKKLRSAVGERVRLHVGRL